MKREARARARRVASRRASSAWPDSVRGGGARSQSARCRVATQVRARSRPRESTSDSHASTMADFDAIYEEEEENEQNLEEHYVAMVPDPIVIRGAGNMTV